MPQRLCPRCNTPFSGNPAFCKSCGRKLDDVPPAPASSWPSRAFLAAGAVLAALALVGVLYAALTPGGSGARPTAATAATAAGGASPAGESRTTTAATPDPTEAPAPTADDASSAAATGEPTVTIAAPTETRAAAATNTATAAPTDTAAPTPADTASATPALTTATSTPTAAGPTRVVQGVRPEFAYTNRVATENGVSLTRMRAQPDVDSDRRGQLTNGDEIELLRQDIEGWYEVRVLRSVVPASVGEVGWIERWLVDGEPAPPTPTLAPPTDTPRPRPPTQTRTPSRLRVSLLNYNDNPSCISMRITGINAAGWRLTIDGLNLGATFDGGGNARVCGLANSQEVTFSIRNANGGVVTGGGGIPAKGSAIFLGEWR